MPAQSLARCNAAKPRQVFGARSRCSRQVRLLSTLAFNSKRAVAAQAFPRWAFMWQDLVDKNLRTVKVQEAADLAKNGSCVLIDVRLREDYDKCTIEGAASVPLFQAMDFSKSTPQSLFKAAAYAFNGVKAVEQNPDFAEQLKKASGGKKVIMFCETGGTMKPTANFVNGKTSRSLKAAWVALDGKLAPEVLHLEGGIFSWYQADLPLTGEYDTSNVGRTPNAAPEPKLTGAAAPAKKGWF